MPALEMANKEFLQAIMSYGIMNARQVKEVINDIMRRHGIQSDFATYMTGVVAAINSALEPYDMQVNNECVSTAYSRCNGPAWKKNPDMFSLLKSVGAGSNCI